IEGVTPRGVDYGTLGAVFAAVRRVDLCGVGVGPRAAARGADSAAEVEIELDDAAHATDRDVPIQVAVTCSTCKGSGAEPGTSPVRCPVCGGTGRLRSVSSTVFGQFVRTETCGRCGGVGTVVEHPCPTCEGAGRVVEERKLTVEIPPG